jgi:carboxyl-terminal processing protease
MSDSEYRKTLKDISKRITEGVSLQKALDLLNAADGKKVEITVERSGSAEPVKLSLTTASVSFPPVEVKNVNDKVAYLRITQFGPAADSALSDALKQAGDRSLVIDLRDNPGAPVPGDGVLPDAARKLLAALTKGGKVGNLVVKGNKSDAITVSGTAVAAPRLAVLVNGGTANTAELVASALKERAGAKLVGTKTFGDAILQRLVSLKSGGAMTIAAGKYLTANGAEFNGKGLTPDIAAAGSSPSANDSAVQRAISALAGA